MRFRKRIHEVPGLNTTSTADISFMLLIFFLVTTSMDVDKGLSRQLPPPEPEKQKKAPTVVDKQNLMVLQLTADNKLLMDEKPIQVANLQEKALLFMQRLGKKHIISLESDRNADYNLYFQMQNQLMVAYAEWRNIYAQKHYGKPYNRLSTDDKEKVKDACPQRITESYANASVAQNKDSIAQEKGGQQ